MGFTDTRAARRFAPDKLQKLNLFETPQMFCDVYCLEPGQSQKAHAHEGATKLYFVLEGRGAFTAGAERRTLSAGELAWSPAGETHAVENDSPARLVVLVAMAPNPNVAAR